MAVGVLDATGGGRAGVMTFTVDGASRSDLTHEYFLCSKEDDDATGLSLICDSKSMSNSALF